MTEHQQPADLVIEVRDVGTSVEIAVSGELDIATAPALRREVAGVLGAHPEIAIVDLSGVEFIDSSGIHALLASRSHALAAGTRLVVVRPGGAADRAFELSGLAEVFPCLEQPEPAADGAQQPMPAL